jgi:hypothetical protein
MTTEERCSRRFRPRCFTRTRATVAALVLAAAALGARHAQAACTNDPGEPNDTFGSAYAITCGQALAAKICTGTRALRRWPRTRGQRRTSPPVDGVHDAHHGRPDVGDAAHCP